MHFCGVGEFACIFLCVCGVCGEEGISNVL